MMPQNNLTNKNYHQLDPRLICTPISLFLRIGDSLCLRLGQIGFSRWELIFAIFKKQPVPTNDNIFVLVKYVQSGCNRTTYFQTVLHYAYPV